MSGDQIKREYQETGEQKAEQVLPEINPKHLVIEEQKTQPLLSNSAQSRSSKTREKKAQCQPVSSQSRSSATAVTDTEPFQAVTKRKFPEIADGETRQWRAISRSLSSANADLIAYREMLATQQTKHLPPST